MTIGPKAKNDIGTVFQQGVSIVTAGGSAVSAYGPILGANVAVVALMVPGSGSTQTTFALAGAAVGDPILVGPPSSVSINIGWNAFVGSAGNVTLRLFGSEGTSTSVTTQTAQTWSFSLIRRSMVTAALNTRDIG